MSAGGASAATGRKVCVAVISTPHGVRGLVRLRPFTVDAAAVTAYGPLTDQDGHRRYEIELLSSAKGQWLARVAGVETRTAAEGLRGTRLYVDRDRLPPLDDGDEFYHADLIGLAVEDTSGRPIGTVRAIHDFGAGDVLEVVRPGAATLTLPFTRAVVPEIDLAGGRVVIDPPDPMDAGAQASDASEP